MIVVVPIDLGSEPLTTLVDESALEPAEANELYAAAVTDVICSAESSGGSVLVNYRGRASDVDGRDGAAAARSFVSDGLDDPDAVRFEPQVGSNRSARIGNTVTHILTREDASSVGILSPTAPLVRRPEIDGVAMSARRNEVILGSNGVGGLYLSAFSEPIDFTDAYRPPAVASVARRASEAGLGVGFAPAVATIDTEVGLAATIATIQARRSASKPIPTETARVVSDLEVTTHDGRSLSRS
ncbi:hypothetical protein [Halovivax gelatinilyticus]|uniref:hypothetical protein n=1 Tax=Halovivax gelatinilyticus TaxID=2961597 RepID=UPI0020CA5F66|nr:hypothetical protein [Halovivax gelatinilyticus]